MTKKGHSAGYINTKHAFPQRSECGCPRGRVKNGHARKPSPSKGAPQSVKLRYEKKTQPYCRQIFTKIHPMKIRQGYKRKSFQQVFVTGRGSM